MDFSKFIVKIADTQTEKEQTYRLRYKEMLREFNNELSESEGLDKSEYDDYAKLLIVKDVEKDEVIASYRLTDPADLPSGMKLVCESEFNIDKIRATGDKICEVSRAIVHKDYRDGAVVMLLVKGMLNYVIDNKFRFILGDACFFGTDKSKYVKELSFLAQRHGIDEALMVTSLDDEQIEQIDTSNYNEKEMSRMLPPLLRTYLMFGSKVSDTAFTDNEFKSVDVFVLLDTQNYNEAAVRRFIR